MKPRARHLFPAFLLLLTIVAMFATAAAAAPADSTAGSASAQPPATPRPIGLDSPNHYEFNNALLELASRDEAGSLEALRILEADSILVERFADYERPAEQRENLDEVGDRYVELAIFAVANMKRDVNRVARRFEYRRVTGIDCSFDLPGQAKDLLAEQGAVVMPWTRNEIFEWYDEVYPYVTTDFVYHTFIILVRAALDELEGQYLQDRIAELSRDWAMSCMEMAPDLDSDGREMALDNAALLAVAASLAVEGDTAVLEAFGLDLQRRAMVEAEVARVREAVYVGPSPLLGAVEDYSEYRLRGRASSGERSGCHLARLWLARTLFPVADDKATRRALLIVEALVRKPDLLSLWEQLDSFIGLVGGALDDPDVRRYLDLATSVTGKSGAGALRKVRQDAGAFERFQEAAAKWPLPLIDNTSARGSAGREAILGLRLLGQRRTADGVLMQAMLDDYSWPISGLQVMVGLFDIPEEKDVLGEWREPPSVPEAAAADSLGLMVGFRRCFETLFEYPEGLPELYRSSIWRDKTLNSALGAWAESRHAAASYIKCAHQSLGMKGLRKNRLQGYVEPYPEFYRRLWELAGQWHQLCLTAGVYDDGEPVAAGRVKILDLESWRFEEFRDILLRLRDIAAAELRGELQNEADGEFLKGLGTRMRKIGFNQSSSEKAEEPMSRIIDVATEYYTGQTLEAGVGLSRAIFVVVDHAGEKVVCRGGVYGYHEFNVPFAMRLDDKAWAGISAGGQVLGEGPWLDGRSSLYCRLEDAAGEFLKNPVKNDPLHSSRYEKAPWRMLNQDYARNPPWAGASVPPAGAEILIGLDVGDKLNPHVQRFICRELARHADAPAVRKYWRRTLAAFVEEGRLRSRNFRSEDPRLIRFFWGLQALAVNGEPVDCELLDGLQKVLARYFSTPNRETPMRKPALDWLLELARHRCCGGDR